MANEIVHYFPRSDLRSGHVGLTKMAAKAGYKPSELNPGEFLVFVNSRKTALKIFAANHIVAHYKSPTNYIDIRVLQYIPQAFSGGRFNYSVALQKVLEKDFTKKGIRL